MTIDYEEVIGNINTVEDGRDKISTAAQSIVDLADEMDTYISDAKTGARHSGESAEEAAEEHQMAIDNLLETHREEMKDKAEEIAKLESEVNRLTNMLKAVSEPDTPITADERMAALALNFATLSDRMDKIEALLTNG